MTTGNKFLLSRKTVQDKLIFPPKRKKWEVAYNLQTYVRQMRMFFTKSRTKSGLQITLFR